MENEKNQKLFISDPVYIKEGISGFISFTLQGEIVPEPLSRRYSDFETLRKKLIVNWPGVFIPNLKQIKAIVKKEKDREIVGMNLENINLFLKQISNIDYLINSDEMELFLQNTPNVSNILAHIKEAPYEELLKKYQEIFTDYNGRNFDFLIAKREQDEFLQKLNHNYPILENLADFVAEEKQKFNEFQKNLDGLNFNLCKNISKIKKKIVNPFDRLYEVIVKDYFDTGAMKEAIESNQSLQNSYDKLTKNLTSVNIQLNDLQAGKIDMKNLFSFKGKEDKISKFLEKKEKLEKDIANLGEVIKITLFNMQNQFKDFENESLTTLNNISIENNVDNSSKSSPKNQDNNLIKDDKKFKPEETNLNKTIEELNNTKAQLNNKISNLNIQKTKYENQIKKLTDENMNLSKKCKSLEEKNILGGIKGGNEQKDELLSLYKKIESKDNEINKLKRAIPFELKEGEELLTVIFVSNNQEIHHSLICKNTEIFSLVEKRLYEVFPKYEESENYFLISGNKIKKTKTLEENKIKNSDVIMLNSMEEE